MAVAVREYGSRLPVRWQWIDGPLDPRQGDRIADDLPRGLVVGMPAPASPRIRPRSGRRRAGPRRSQACHPARSLGSRVDTCVGEVEESGLHTQDLAGDPSVLRAAPDDLLRRGRDPELRSSHRG